MHRESAPACAAPEEGRPPPSEAQPCEQEPRRPCSKCSNEELSQPRFALGRLRAAQSSPLQHNMRRGSSTGDVQQGRGGGGGGVRSKAPPAAAPAAGRLRALLRASPFASAAAARRVADAEQGHTEPEASADTSKALRSRGGNVRRPVLLATLLLVVLALLGMAGKRFQQSRQAAAAAQTPGSTVLPPPAAAAQGIGRLAGLLGLGIHSRSDRHRLQQQQQQQAAGATVEFTAPGLFIPPRCGPACRRPVPARDLLATPAASLGGPMPYMTPRLSCSLLLRVQRRPQPGAA